MRSVEVEFVMKNLLKRSILKRSPYELMKNVDQQIKSGKMSQNPAWYGAMKLVPMAPMPSAYEDTTQSGAFAKTDNSIQESQTFFSLSSTRRIQKRKNISVMPVRMCEEIEYPEDRIRSKFYSSHPFELNRPRSLIDDDYSLVNRDWSSIHGGNIEAPVTGESVVQYTLYLMSKNGGSMTEEDAYAKALQDFYQARKDEEIREREESKLRKTKPVVSLGESEISEAVQGAIEDLETLESKSIKHKSESILKLEQAEIDDGKVFAQEKFEA